ncbi:hypothetical protein D3C78_1640080 [compost metagenome]
MSKKKSRDHQGARFFVCTDEFLWLATVGLELKPDYRILDFLLGRRRHDPAAMRVASHLSKAQDCSCNRRITGIASR